MLPDTAELGVLVIAILRKPGISDFAKNDSWYGWGSFTPDVLEFLKILIFLAR